tara:strand:+ start:543 stop:1310 length:768 start_codon:yes stop_codon:yes gene_type:complete
MSSCSQKVRLVLEEKKLLWTGIHMDLRKGETRTPEYMKNLNKNGVVPTLIDGDDIIIESTIIQEYLEDEFPITPLRPRNSNDIARMRLLNKNIDDSLHSAIAIISSCIAFRHQFIKSYNKAQINKLVEMIPDEKRREISKDTIFNGLESTYLPDALSKYLNLFDDFDTYLSNNEWLAGDNYSLADVSYTPYLTRFEHLNLSFMFKEKKNLYSWFLKIQQRENYKRAITNWNNANYLKLMHAKGSDAHIKIAKIIS